MDRSFVIGLASFALTAAILAVPVIADAAMDGASDPAISEAVQTDADVPPLPND